MKNASTDSNVALLFSIVLAIAMIFVSDGWVQNLGYSPLSFIVWSLLMASVGALASCIFYGDRWRARAEKAEPERDSLKRSVEFMEAQIDRDFMRHGEDWDHLKRCKEVLSAMSPLSPQVRKAYVLELVSDGTIEKREQSGKVLEDLLRYECLSGFDVERDEDGMWQVSFESEVTLEREDLPSPDERYWIDVSDKASEAAAHIFNAGLDYANKLLEDELKASPKGKASNEDSKEE